MIEFLAGAFSVLSVRADKIVKTLNEKKGVPASVSEHCQRVSRRTERIIDSINNKQDVLQQITQELAAKRIVASQANALLKQILKSYRASRREVDVIEENFVGHLARYNDADLFFTKLASALWKETNFPDTAPIAVTNTSGYFCTWAALGIVFSPPSSEHNLLIFPDLYHEFGHILHQGIKVQLFGKRFEAELKSYVLELDNKIKRTSRPLEQNTILDIALRWQNSWAEEVACDTLATHILGPAYGWCNLHLCLQSPNVFERGREHPADAARTKNILKVLRRRGFSADADKMEKLWNQYVQLSQQIISSHYNDYHPDGLFTAVMEDVEEAIKDNNLGITGKSPTVDVLNESWKQFIENTSNYNDWEENAIADLKKIFV